MEEAEHAAGVRFGSWQEVIKMTDDDIEALIVQRVEREQRFVVTEESRERDVRVGHASGGVDARRDAESDVPARIGHLEPGMQAEECERAGCELTERQEAAVCQCPVAAAQFHNVCD